MRIYKYRKEQKMASIYDLVQSSYMKLQGKISTELKGSLESKEDMAWCIHPG